MSTTGFMPFFAPQPAQVERTIYTEERDEYGQPVAHVTLEDINIILSLTMGDAQDATGIAKDITGQVILPVGAPSNPSDIYIINGERYAVTETHEQPVPIFGRSQLAPLNPIIGVRRIDNRGGK